MGHVYFHANIAPRVWLYGAGGHFRQDASLETTNTAEKQPLLHSQTENELGGLWITQRRPCPD
jgi:hypothetical protein